VGLAIDAVEEHDKDFVLDVEVPSNRPDCLSHLGIAREVAVIEKQQLLLPSSKTTKVHGKAADLTSVEILDAHLCPRYAARLVRGVTIAPSPAWLSERLQAIGQRPINNVADITNYVLHELGQPLHAFDFAKLSEHRIVVRRARAGEKLKTLDGLERILTSEMLVIADAERPVALAGIMGGEDSEISQSTSDVLIESAYFDPDSIRRTARALGMDTEASRRFERGADRENVLAAQQRCVELICEMAGGVATEDALDVYPKIVDARVVSLRPARVMELTSLSVEVSEMQRILSGLGFLQIEDKKSTLTFRVPSWRVDIEQEEDLVEEIARHTGYDQIGSELPPSRLPGEYQPYELRQRGLRRALNAFGFDEAINFSFIPPQANFELVPEFSGAEVQLSNPIIEDASRMRQTLLPGLLNSVRHNLNHGIRDVRLFEIGRIFSVSHDGTLPEERQAFAMVATGGRVQEGRALAEGDTDFYDIKGALETAVEWMNISGLVFKKDSVRHLQEGQAAVIYTTNEHRIGSIGRLEEHIAASHKFRQPVYVMELDLSSLMASPERIIHYSPLPRYPSVVRDLSLLLNRTTTFEEIVKAIEVLHIRDCEAVKLVGTYEGPNIPPDKRSITVRIEYRSDDRTLRDEEVEERHQELTSWLLKTFSAEQR
jgi:phenylalanyl-tRNA synthetase beta chain